MASGERLSSETMLMSGANRLMASMKLQAQSEAWWEANRKWQEKERTEGRLGPGEILEVEGWPTIAAGTIVDAECLK
jgi:hypothetical protein